MLVDARRFGHGHIERATVCVIGAGPAGITVAQELVRQGIDVCLVESGGLEPDPLAQSLCAGETRGDGDQSLSTTRVRRFGGTSTTWEIDVGDGHRHVRWTALQAADFDTKPWVPDSGWPFSRETLAPYYGRARAVCGLGDGPSAPNESTPAPSLSFPSGRLESTSFEIGRAEVFVALGRALGRHRRARVVTGATVLGLDLAPDASHVVRARAGNSAGARFAFEASTFVVAAGAIENARLLLLSDQVRPAGIGNGHDLVGRCFMDHSLDYGDRFVPATRRVFAVSGFYDIFPNGPDWAMGRLTIADDTLRDEPLLNTIVHLLPRHRSHGPLAVQALRLATRRELGALPVGNGRLTARTVVTEAAVVIERTTRRLLGRHEAVPLLAAGGWSRAVEEPGRTFGYFELVAQTEQLPDRANRVRLGDELDALGQRRAVVEWRWSALELAALQRTRDLIREELHSTGARTVRVKRGPATHTGCHHHLGTTRMNASARNGVVNADGRVHEVTNLFVAGGSVFPTGGAANPTLTIVALAIRLADHLVALRPR